MVGMNNLLNWNQKPLVDNQGDFFMHVLAMSCNR